MKECRAKMGAGRGGAGRGGAPDGGRCAPHSSSSLTPSRPPPPPPPPSLTPFASPARLLPRVRVAAAGVAVGRPG